MLSHTIQPRQDVSQMALPCPRQRQRPLLEGLLLEVQLPREVLLVVLLGLPLVPLVWLGLPLGLLVLLGQ